MDRGHVFRAGSFVLFCHSTDTKALEAIFAESPMVKISQARALICQQWIGKGVVR